MSRKKSFSYRAMQNWENVNIARYYGYGKYEIPRMSPCTEVDVDEWIGFNYAMSCPPELRRRTGVHFWLDDYQFYRCWQQPRRYAEALKQFGAVCSPDFSVYTDFPTAMRIWNVYRNSWLAVFWQENGINVVPTAMWSDLGSYEYVWTGYPKKSIVAVSSVGNYKDRETLTKFIYGYHDMLNELEPTKVLFYGRIPEECMSDLIVPIRSFQQNRLEALPKRKSRKGLMEDGEESDERGDIRI